LRFELTTMTGIVAKFFKLLCSEECYGPLFEQFDFSNQTCVKLLISKCLGYVILAGSFLMKVPQIISIKRSGSAKGVSPLMYYLDSVVLLVSSAYGFRKDMPFSTYGEAYFLLAQNLIILFQIHFYSKKLGSFVVKALLFAAVVLYLFPLLGDSVVSIPLPLLATLQTVLPVPVGALSRIPQIYAIYANSSAGAVSLLMFLMNTAGAVARIFTTLTEVNDFAVLAGYLSSTLLNGIITAQIIYYTFLVTPASGKSPKGKSPKGKKA
jgi:mannose-P-dolichol utilization defect protein 1